MSLAGLAQLEQVGEGHFVGDFDASWGQGPGVYGGLVAASVGVCLERSEPERALRALSLHLCAPVIPGPVEVHLTSRRRGSAASFYSGEVHVGGQPAVLVNAVLSRDRTRDADFERAVPPEMPGPDQLPDIQGAPGIPVFTDHFDFRFHHGAPFSGAAEANTGGWVRPRQPEPLSTALALALLDVWPLALLPVLDQPRPATSVAIHFQLLSPLAAQAPDAWYAVDVRSPVCRGGYSDQVSALFDARGGLIGRCQQLVALIR